MTQPHHSPDASGTSDSPAPPPGCPAHSGPDDSGKDDSGKEPGAVPLYGPWFQNNAAQLYRGIRREHGPVAPIVLEGGVPAWLMLGYREVHQVTTNSQVFAEDSRRRHAWDSTPAEWPLMPYVGYQPTVLFAEGAEHQRRAGAISDALSAIDQFELRSLCERVSDGLIDTFAGRGEADLIAEYSHQIPLLVVAQLFGLPDSDVPALVQDIAASLDEGDDAINAHMRNVARMQGPGVSPPAALCQGIAGPARRGARGALRHPDNDLDAK